MKRRRAKAQTIENDEASGTEAVGPNDHYILKLYVNGDMPNSNHAIVNIRKLCEEHLGGRYDLEIFDISVEPELAQKAHLIGIPALIKLKPLPLRHFIGDMSRTDVLLSRLDIVRPFIPANG